MSRFVSPPIDQLEKLRQPLTDGERIVFDLFNAHLPVEWEIYLQPHLNGLRPDFVLLHPKVGIAVFEVKDWNLQAMQFMMIDEGSVEPLRHQNFSLLLGTELKKSSIKLPTSKTSLPNLIFLKTLSDLYDMFRVCRFIFWKRVVSFFFCFFSNTFQVA